MADAKKRIGTGLQRKLCSFVASTSGKRKKWRKFPRRSVLFKTARGQAIAAKTETLTIALPIELLENIRANVAAGKFASESEAIVQTLREADDFPAPAGFRQIGVVRKRVTLLFHVGAESVSILAIHYRGRQHDLP